MKKTADDLKKTKETRDTPEEITKEINYLINNVIKKLNENFVNKFNQINKIKINYTLKVISNIKLFKYHNRFNK